MENRSDTIKIGLNLIVDKIITNSYTKCDNPWQTKGTNYSPPDRPDPSELCAHTFTINLSSLP